MEKEGRLHSLDVIRGFAALSVVLWHWQHIQLLGSSQLAWPGPPGVVSREAEPFYWILRPFYEYGSYAVDLFFLLSGFVFYWLYREKIARSSVTSARFFIARFSRLYPLHLAALVIVAALALWFHSLSGQFFVYEKSSSVYFLLSLLFIQLPRTHAAFNGPEWSLTIELIMYCLFFFAVRLRPLQHNFAVVLAIAIGLVLWRLDVATALARGLCGFFLGGVIFAVYTRIVADARSNATFVALAFLTSAGWGIVLADIYSSGALHSRLAALGLQFNDLTVFLSILYGLFPVSILTAVLHERLFGARYSLLAWLGEASYSSYLLHFPLQLSIAIAVYSGLFSTAAARSNLAFITYFAILLPLSVLAFRYFERPMQDWIRRITDRPRVVVETSVVE